VYRQASHWYAADNAAVYAPDRFPVMLWIHGSAEHDYIYAFPFPFPSVDGATVKAASERYSAPIDPDAVDRVVTPEESASIHARHVAGRLLGVGSHVVRAGTCLYTVTPDAGFLVDRMPGTSRVIVASACSGHGFKHSPALSEALAGMATANDIPESMAAFALERFAA
jgi:sarcosine oxidase